MKRWGEPGKLWLIRKEASDNAARDAIVDALRKAGSVRGAAALLDMDARNLRRAMHSLGLRKD